LQGLTRWLQNYCFMASADIGREAFIVQRLDEELLVYDTAADEVHCLSGNAVAEFEAAADEVSRRDVIRRMALAGAAAAGGAALVRSVIAPNPAQAQSTCVCGISGNLICGPNEACGGTVCVHCKPSNAVCTGGDLCCTSICTAPVPCPISGTCP
jgi:hypothetical protein